MLNKHRMYLWLKRVSLMVVIAPIAMLWGEGYTRMLIHQNVDSKMNILASDSIIGYTYKPNSSTYEKGREYNALYIINSLGLRDREYHGHTSDSTFRILLLGDSFSVSHGLAIEESLSQQMEKALLQTATGDALHRKIEVINGAVGGYSPYNYWKAYLKWKPIFHPNVVIVGISPDDYDSSNAGLNYIIEDDDIIATYKDGETPQKKGGSLTIRLRKWLSWNSEFYVLLRNFLYYNEIVDRIGMIISSNGEERINQIEKYLIVQPEKMKLHWSQSLLFLKKLHESCDTDRTPLVMISIPSKEEIDSSLYKHTLSVLGLNESQTNINLPLNKISGFASDNSIVLLDPRPSLKSHNSEVKCYFDYDGHWNAEGVRYAALYLAQQWRKEGLPPWNHKCQVLHHNNEIRDRVRY